MNFKRLKAFINTKVPDRKPKPPAEVSFPRESTVPVPGPSAPPQPPPRGSPAQAARPPGTADTPPKGTADTPPKETAEETARKCNIPSEFVVGGVTRAQFELSRGASTSGRGVGPGPKSVRARGGASPARSRAKPSPGASPGAGPPGAQRHPASPGESPGARPRSTPAKRRLSSASGPGAGSPGGHAAPEDGGGAGPSRAPEEGGAGAGAEAGPPPPPGSPGEGGGAPLVITGLACGGTMEVPEEIAGSLSGYQGEGVAFLAMAYTEGRGAVLADDMGTGKSLQTIAFLYAVRQRCREAGKRFTAVLTCPASLKDNWAEELGKWQAQGDPLRAEKLEGPTSDVTLNRVGSGEVDVVLVSHDLMRQRADEVAEFPWHLAVVDEAHNAVANMDTATFEAHDRLGTRLRYALSGTVMSNKYDELFAVVQWVRPDDNPLGDRATFRNTKSLPLRKGFSVDATAEQRAEANRVLAGVLESLAPVLLRRKKVDVCLELPDKTDTVVYCDLSDAQKDSYRRVLQCPEAQWIMEVFRLKGLGYEVGEKNPKVLAGLKGPIYRQQHLCECGDPEGTCRGHRQGVGCVSGNAVVCPMCMAMPLLILLGKVANHLELLKVDPDEPNVVRAGYARDVARMALGAGAETDRTADVNVLMDPRQCGKLGKIQELLQEGAREGKKTLVFSMGKRMLDIIEQVVMAAFGASYLRLDGDTPAGERQAMCRRFNADPTLRVFLISTRAGGTGLNLTGAQRVLIVDPSWNPSDDAQAMDRAFRRGQERDVEVFRLVSRETVEEVKYTRQVYKRQHSEQVLGGERMTPVFRGVSKEARGEAAGAKGDLFGVESLFRDSYERFQNLREGVREYAGLTLAANVRLVGAEGGGQGAMAPAVKPAVGPEGDDSGANPAVKSASGPEGDDSGARPAVKPEEGGAGPQKRRRVLPGSWGRPQ